MMRRRRRQRKKRIPQLGGCLLDALSVLVPVGKGATLGMAKALGHRAVKMGSKAATGAALSAATSGAAYGVRKLLKKKTAKKETIQCDSRLSR